MSARVVTSWVLGEGDDKGDDDSGAPQGRWRVWVKSDGGRWKYLGTNPGFVSEAEAIAAALAATGAQRGFALQDIELLLPQQSTSPGDAQTSRGVATGGQVLMQRKGTPAQSNSGLGDELRAAVAAIEGVTLEDRGSYYIVKRGTTTLGYVNGKRKFRIEAPRRSGKAPIAVTSPRQIPRAVKFLRSCIPVERAEKVAS